MQIIFLSPAWTIALCFVVWPLLQFSAAKVCHILPDQTFSQESWFFRTHAFENGGRIYNSIFRVSKWKRLLPDASIAPKGKRYVKKHLKEYSEENLQRFVLESARAELTHWLAIPCFIIFGFFVPSSVLWIMLVYALLVNLPCIIAQRYNRPRVLRLLAKVKESQTRS